MRLQSLGYELALGVSIVSMLLTNIARQHEEVIVGKSTVLPGVNQFMDAEPISGLVVLAEDLQSLGVIHGLTSGEQWCTRAAVVAVQNRHLV